MRIKLLLFLALSGSVALAQRSISGIVQDESGPLPGVSVIIKGSKQGTTTDFDGKYVIKVPNDEAILVFSFIGIKTKEIKIGDRQVLDVMLEQDSQKLDEVVINALGFEVKTDKLGSAVSSVKTDAMVRSGELNISNAIQGKMSGVNITRSNGDPGAGSNIRIRGANTIYGNMQPLVILDGMPISDTSTHGKASSGTSNGVSQQSRLNDINPNDIESLQVLKGASAAALWGSRASNGVIVITTKSGRKGFKVSFRSSVAIDEVNRIAPTQTTYSSGTGGVYRQDYVRAWGDEIATRTGGNDVIDTNGAYFVGDQTGKKYYPITRGSSSNPHGNKHSKKTYEKENFDKVFRQGIMLENSISVSTGNKKSNLFFSLGNTNQEGIIRNNNYNRYTLSINGVTKLNDMFKLNVKAKYSKVDANRVQQNSNTAGLLLGYYRTPADFDISDYTGTYTATDGSQSAQRHRAYRNPIGSSSNPRYNNPLWTIYEQQAPNTVHRHIYSAELDITPISELNIKLRSGVDTYTDHRKYFFSRGSATTSSYARLLGNLTYENISETQFNLDAIATYNIEFSENITSSFVLGWNINDRGFHRENIVGTDFIVNKKLYTLGNVKSIAADNKIQRIVSNRGFATANIGFYNQLYLDVTGTSEAVSTVSSSFFYPSASVAWQFSNAPFFPMNDIISFGKVRLSWGKVGVQPLPYRAATYYKANNVYSGGLWGRLSSVSNGGGLMHDESAGNADLKPEIKTEIETGLELRFFNNKLSTSFTYYNNEVNDILLNLTQAPSSGFSSTYRNGAAMKNQGYEFEFNANLLNSTDWKFNTYGNFARNKNEVTDLAGADVQKLAGFGTGDSVASKGHQMGAIFGGKLPRKDDGSIKLDANGFPEGTPVYDVIGDPNPDWTAGLGFNIGYKNISLNVLFEHSQGGDFYDMTRQVNSQRGHSEEVGRKVTIPKDGIKDINGNTYTEGQVVRGNLHDFGAGLVLLEERWYVGKGASNRGFSELWLQDATWTRLREISLTYKLGENILKLLNLSDVSFRITGRNLVLWTELIGNDPDKNLTGVSNARGLDYYTNPTTRSYLFNLNITF